MEKVKTAPISIPSSVWVQIAPGVQVWQDSGRAQLLDGEPRDVAFRVRLAESAR